MRWRIESPERAVRLYALRELSEVGELGAWDLLERGLREPRAAWALARCAPEGLRLYPLARFMRYRRKRAWAKKMDRTACLVRLRAARHEMAAFAWADRVVLEHGEKAIPGLLDCLRHPSSPAVAEAAAWALGRLGRVVLAEVLDAFRQAIPPTVRRLAPVLWYLGPEAHGAEKVLVRWLGEPEVDAALLAMEGVASRAVAAAGGPHVWLDSKAVDELALRVYGETNRADWVSSLGGFGPALEQAVQVLEPLLHDPDLRALALQALARIDHPAAARLLFEQGEPCDALALLYTESPVAQRAALEALQGVSLWPCDLDRCRELVESEVPGVRQAALELLPLDAAFRRATRRRASAS